MSPYKWAILLLVAVSLLVSACTVASAQGGVVKISYPPKNGNAGPTERVSGKAQLSKGYSLWIVAYDPTAGKYYPEAPSPTVHSDATWLSNLSVGTIFGVGKTFQIYAVVADQSASTSLRSSTTQRTAITKLPQGAQPVDAVTVKRVAADVSAPAASSSSSAVSRTAGSSATARASTSAATVAPATAAASSQNPLPGFEVVYALGALAAAAFVALRVTRRS